MRENWTYKKLGEVTTFKRGLTYSRKDEVNFSENVVLRSNNIDLATNSLNLDELKYISSDICIPEDKKLKADSIFMCMSNGSKQHLGKVAFIEHDLSYAFGGFMGLIIPEKEKIYPKYLYFYFCSPQFKDVLSSIGNGANINNIKFVDIAKYSIKTPPLSEQKSIVSELDRINELISLKKAQLNDLDALAQSIFYDMFGDFEDDTPLSHFINSLGGGKSLAGMVPCINKVLKTGAVTYDCFDGNAVKDLPIDYVPLPEHLLKNGDLLVSRMNSPELVGSCAYVWKAPANTYLPDRLWRAELKQGNNPIYLWFSIIQLKAKEQIRTLASGTSGSMKNISKPRFLSVKIKNVPLSLQQEFAKRIELIEQQKAQISSTIKDLETLLASRMQYWFN